MIVSGSSDSMVRVWDIRRGIMVNTLPHHREAVLHLRFSNGIMVTCSKVRLSFLEVGFWFFFRIVGIISTF